MLIVTFLFTGDSTSREEEAALSVDSARADVLKVAHHGSKTSADDAFVADLLPAAAVISVGRGNSYGHPNQETLDLLGKYDIKTLIESFLPNVGFIISLASSKSKSVCFEVAYHEIV